MWVFALRGVSVCLCLRFALCLFFYSVLGGGLFNILKQAFSNCYTYGIFIKILSAISLCSQPSNMLKTENIFISDGQVLMQTMYPKQNALMSLIVNYPLSKQKTLTWTHKLSNKHSPHNLIYNKHQDNNFIIWGLNYFFLFWISRHLLIRASVLTEISLVAFGVIA